MKKRERPSPAFDHGPGLLPRRDFLCSPLRPVLELRNVHQIFLPCYSALPAGFWSGTGAKGPVSGARSGQRLGARNGLEQPVSADSNQSAGGAKQCFSADVAGGANRRGPQGTAASAGARFYSCSRRSSAPPSQKAASRSALISSALDISSRPHPKASPETRLRRAR